MYLLFIFSSAKMKKSNSLRKLISRKCMPLQLNSRKNNLNCNWTGSVTNHRSVTYTLQPVFNAIQFQFCSFPVINFILYAGIINLRTHETPCHS